MSAFMIIACKMHDRDKFINDYEEHSNEISFQTNYRKAAIELIKTINDL